jgi:iron complex outermembrane receptor protein
MKPVLLLKSLLLTGSFALLLATSAWGEEVQLPKKQQETTSNDQEAISKQTANQPYSLAKKTLKHRTKSTQKLVQASVVVQVTGVKLNSVDKQLEIILETTQGEQLQPLSKSEGIILLQISPTLNCVYRLVRYSAKKTHSQELQQLL